jgi:hypothetical protein
MNMRCRKELFTDMEIVLEVESERRTSSGIICKVRHHIK